MAVNLCYQFMRINFTIMHLSNACFGKANCKSCVEDYKPSCLKCVDDIYDETAQIQSPSTNTNTIICDNNNQMHSTVCNFFCRSLFKPFYKCEVINSFPLCTCMDTVPTTPTTTTTTTTTTTSFIPGLFVFGLI